MSLNIDSNACDSRSERLNIFAVNDRRTQEERKMFVAIQSAIDSVIRVPLSSSRLFLERYIRAMCVCIYFWTQVTDTRVMLCLHTRYRNENRQLVEKILNVKRMKENLV